MKVHFFLHYSTRPGQNLSLAFDHDGHEHPMEYLNDSLWEAVVEFDPAMLGKVRYHYVLHDKSGGPGGTPTPKADWDTDRSLDLAGAKADSVQVFDYWNPVGAVENAFFTQPFRDILLKNEAAEKPKKAAIYTHIFRVKAPILPQDEAICLLGHGTALRSWDTAAPLVLSRSGSWWEIRLDLSREDFPLAYKYGTWNTRTMRHTGFESGSNRVIFPPASGGSLTILHDGFARIPTPKWRGAGVAIPVFSLRTEKSFGVGEFTDLPALADWAKSTGLRLLQLLPINDTSATGTWTDSYPYAAISAFALHPIYLNLEAVAGKKHAATLKPFAKKQKELNALEAVDYEAVMSEKWKAVRLLFDLQKDDWAADAGYQQYFAENKHWLVPYAAFCFLKEKHGTAEFATWPEHAQYDAAAIEKLLAGNSKLKTQNSELAIHLFVQWHLHLQLKAATDYAHAQGLVVKGDIPIGIYRHSCDAWVAPELYNMDKQAGAPPDDFAEKGQNWGFPTYNWAQMGADGFAWWRQRFAQMSLYFDAFRIDHILGFFRIWSIPLDAVEGILGQFVPALPVRGEELVPAGVSLERLCRPYITDAVLREEFSPTDTDFVRENCLTRRADGTYELKPAFSTQQQVEAWFEQTQNSKLETQNLKTGLFNLIANVLLFEVPGSNGREFHFRFGIEKTASFRHLDGRVQRILKDLYVDYFYRRQDDFWQTEAMEKLPALKRATQMLICGEDLGMVPHCVPDVMAELGILSLEIQRMPKAAGSTFFHPKDAPYLSVVTPSTHDMSTIRGWWEEDRELSRRFYREVLGWDGEVPYFCEPWVNYAIVEQHFYSPAMWAIFQLQDLLGIDGQLRRENPADERINIPANPKHYWRYRMHLSLEKLAGAEHFNNSVRGLVAGSGRG